MTIQEAIDVIKQEYYAEDCCLVAELAPALEMAIDALAIKDRLEQADVTKHADEYEANSPNPVEVGFNAGYFIGYDQALADIRGDKDG